MEAEAIELGSIGTRARCQALAVCMGLAVLGCVTGCNRVTLVSGVSPSSIAIGDTDVYFTNAATLPNELDRVPLDGGAKTTIATSTTNMSSLVRFGSSIFWANIGTLPADAGVWQLSLRSGSPVQVSHHGEDLVSNQAVAVYATGNTPADTVTHVLYGVPAVAKLYDTSLSASGSSEVSLLPDTDPITHHNYYPFSLVVDATNVYFTHDGGGGVFRAPLSGGAATMLVGSVVRTTLAIDGSTLFFQQGNDINQIAVTGGPVTTFAPGTGVVTAMVAHAGTVYWTCGTCGTVVKQLVGATISTMLASGEDNPHAIAADDTHVYFGTNSGLVRIDD